MLLLSRRAFVTTAVSTTLVRPTAASAATAYAVVVYGATPSGIMAACAAAREGVRTALVFGNSPLGGMCAGGLGYTDYRTIKLVGGLALSFFKRVGTHYNLPFSWLLEPHVALEVFRSFLTEYGVDLYPYDLDQASPLLKQGARLLALRLEDHTVLKADAFIDASYEGDLLAFSGASYTYGREARAQYGETLAGFAPQTNTTSGPATNSRGKLLPGVKPFPNIPSGAADQAVMAYNFRLCLSNEPTNMVRFVKPPGYDPARYQVGLQAIRASGGSAMFLPEPLMNRKFDLNGNYKNGDYVGGSWGYPIGTRAGRAHIWRDHYNYQAGMCYFLANDKSVPAYYRDEVNSYGLAKDEFVANANWPNQLYVRESRRLVGRYVMTQADVQTRLAKTDTIGMGCYHIDGHDTQMLAMPDGTVFLDGPFSSDNGAARVDAAGEYQIPYRALLPQSSQTTNLLVSVCVSASRVAFASLRIEVQYMVMGEAAGVAAALAAGNVAAVDVSAVQTKLRGYGAVLSL